MSYKCRLCGCTESQTLADAKTLGLQRGLQVGLYTCCQIAAWADEQLLAWLEAAREDSKSADAITQPLQRDATKAFAPITKQHTRNRGF